MNRSLIVLFVSLTLFGLFPCIMNAQEAVAVPAGAVRPDRPVPPGSSPNVTPNGNPESKPGEGEKGKEGKKDESGPKVIKRSEYTPTPEEGDIKVDVGPDGKVKFNFNGANWPLVLNWLARFSQLNLDWQELPGDDLNLRTQRSYTAEEARDVINRHLLARGYTLLEQGELLTVVQIKNIDPGLVPRVEPEELLTRMPHEFVKVSLPLDWIIADEAVEQLKPMLSTNGKLSAISAVNRLEAMDAVANLREVYQMLVDEQSPNQEDQNLVREFQLKHVRASQVIDSLYAILGVRKPQDFSGSSGGGSISSGYSQMIMQQLQQMQQAMQRNQGGNSGGAGGKEEIEPKLVLNERENSILAYAPPDKMEIIKQTVLALDVESQSNSHILQNLDRMKVYRLATLKPQPLVQILSEIGDLSPTVKIQVDEENSSIILYGTLADHVTVQTLVEKLDGSSRNFEVITLRRVKAAEVAGTIQYMFGEEEKDEDSRQSRYSYSYSYYRDNDEKSKESRPFKIEADIEHNRLLVWANEIELEEIENLLAKMGEIKPGQSNPATARMIDLHSLENAQQLIEQIQRTWQQQQPNPLNIDQPQPVTPPATDNENTDTKKEARLNGQRVIRHATDELVRPETSSQVDAPVADTEIDRNSLTNQELLKRFEQLQKETSQPPAVNVRQLPDGRLFLESQDTRALDELELMIADLLAPAPDYKLYKIRYAWPYNIELLLEDFFASGDDEETILDWYGNAVTYNKEGPSRLSNKRKLKIISDDDSMTLLVQNATLEQLALIENLLEIYDRPDSSDPKSIRVTKHFKLEYSKAAVISETLKSVYRDLLSSNDPALQNKNQEGKQQPAQAGITYTYVRGGSEGEEEGREPEEPIRFKGLLSVGIDEISNTIVVSAASGLMDDISELIETLDKAAKPDLHVQIAPVNPRIDASLLRDRLNLSFGIKPATVGVSSTADRNGNKQPGQGDQPPGQGTPSGQQNGQMNGNPVSN